MFRLIAIIEPSRIIREGLASLLRNHNICQRIGSLESLSEWRPAFKDTNPDIVIINPDFWRKGDLKKLKNRYINDKVILIGIIYQYCDPETLSQFNETIYITDSEDTIINKLRKLQQQANYSSNRQNLTAREKDVLRLLLQGFSNKEVADKLTISIHTVIAHRKNVIDKTGIRSLSGLAVYALLNNITDMGKINK